MMVVYEDSLFDDYGFQLYNYFFVWSVCCYENIYVYFMQFDVCIIYCLVFEISLIKCEFFDVGIKVMLVQFQFLEEWMLLDFICMW